MKTNFTQSVYALIALVLTSSSLTAQNGAPFKMRYQSSIKGEMTVIANSITNRIDQNGSTSTPYDKILGANLNDELEMAYIDIDSDESTFSSSSASLQLANTQNKKVVYAGLYWSATYKYNPGVVKVDGNFVAIDNKREAIKKVKIKLPNQEDYTDVTGEVIFDGNNLKQYKDNAPYAVYADVTSLVANQENPNGSYTVANVRATNGKVEGGVSSGWTLFVVYEDAQMPEKFIASYDGFANINDNVAPIKISGFKAASNGSVSSKIACAALEGDANLNNDQVFLASSNQGLVALGNKSKSNTNIFNSSISNENGSLVERVPNSQNTLGYDTFMMDVPNVDNAFLDNNTTQTSIKFNSTGDRCYVFFAAFNIQVGETDTPMYASTTTKASTKNDVAVINDSEILKDAYESNMLAQTTTNKYKFEMADKQNVEIREQNIPNQKSAYYVIANVFSDPYFAREFIKELKSQGIEADSFVNPENGFKYVYITKTANEKDAVYSHMVLADNTAYKGNTWVLSVNNSNTFNTNTMLASEE